MSWKDRVEFKLPLIIIRSNVGIGTMEKLGQRKVAKPLGWAFLYAMPVLAGIGLYLFLGVIWVYSSPAGSSVIGYVKTITPLANLLLPGLNPFIPVFDGWAAIVIALVVHEGAHGTIARSLGLKVKSTGLLLLLGIPIGAFVELDDVSLKAANAKDSLRVLAAGVGTNITVAILCLLALGAVVGTMSPAANGAGVVAVASGSPAAQAGILPNDFIVAVNGTHVTDMSTVLGPNTALKAGQALVLTVDRGGTLNNYTVRLVCCVSQYNTQTGKNVTYPYVGMNTVSYNDLGALVGAYSANPLLNARNYLCIPALSRCVSPYSYQLAGLYSSSLGANGQGLANFFFWVWFVNFNLALFNSLPLSIMDGGQAYDTLVRKVFGVGDPRARRIVNATSVLMILMLFVVIAFPYLA